MTPLHSPASGVPLAPEGAHVLREPDGRRWPVVDGIPFLRVGRDALVDAALAALDRDEAAAALAVLLADQDDWWTGPAPSSTDLARLVRERDSLSLREAMDLLGFERVGVYFAHRWTDPTFLAGLALLEAHWRPAVSAFELCCGIGHYGRELLGRGVAYAGGDVVFAKLWLARNWVTGPAADLVCFDAAAPWPVQGRRDLVFCHDAFYFLPRKAEVLRRLRAMVGPGGRLALSHIHNRAAAPLSSGHAVEAGELAELFPDGLFYDDAELTRALAEGRAPRPAPLDALADVDAFAVEDHGDQPQPVREGLALPSSASGCRLNPLYAQADAGIAVRWPSPRYQAEYAPLATYPAVLADPPAAGDPEALRRRILVSLPERW